MVKIGGNPDRQGEFGGTGAVGGGHQARYAAYEE